MEGPITSDEASFDTRLVFVRAACEVGSTEALEKRAGVVLLI